MCRFLNFDGGGEAMLEIRVRLAPAGATATEQRLLRELLAYVGERQEKTTEAFRRGDRMAHVVTLQDGEQLVLLLEGKTFCYWTATRELPERLRARLDQWLTGAARFWRA
jgi:hypothetical protein